MNYIPQPLVTPDPPDALQHFQTVMDRLMDTLTQRREQAEDANEQRKLEKRCWWVEDES